MSNAFQEFHDEAPAPEVAPNLIVEEAKEEPDPVLPPQNVDEPENNIPEPEVALRRAAADGLADVIQALVENVQDLDLNQCGNTSGRTALHFATIYGRTNVVSQLITLGARQDIRDKVKNQLASEYAGASNNAKIRNIQIGRAHV